jgi:hypothetical protein
MSTHEFDIAVLLPTRARTDMLTRSVQSIFNLADNKDSIHLMIGFDRDDTVGIDHFNKELQPWLDDNDVDYTAMMFESMGYEGLNKYYNQLAKQVTADWYFVWNDDAEMKTSGWDSVIKSHNDQFQILKVHTHFEHPYSIFPIVPHKWYELLGTLSRHQMIDAEISQLAYMLDLIKIVDIDVEHKPSPVPKVRFETNIKDPRDFHHVSYYDQRLKDCIVLTTYMRSQGISTEFFENIFKGTQDPWEKLIQNDVNKQMVQFAVTIRNNEFVKV